MIEETKSSLHSYAPKEQAQIAVAYLERAKLTESTSKEVERALEKQDKLV